MSLTQAIPQRAFWTRLVFLCFVFVVGQDLPGQAPKESEPEQKASGEVTILAWNIEIGGSEVETILDQLKGLMPYDVLALSEVPRKSVDPFVQRWGKEAAFVGAKGGEACLCVAWDPSKLERIETNELTQFNGQEFAPGIQAAPLVVKLRQKATQREFVVVMNHLARGSAELRKRQATILVDWAKQQSDPVIAVGGYNFDYDIPTKKGNEAFDVFMKEGVWKWVEPKQMVDTNWSDRNNDGKDEYPDSMLDFVFATGPAKAWKIDSEIVVRDGDFPDNEQTSDQRPIRTIVTLPASK